MNHEEWEILVSAYHDGELTPEEAARLESHMATCAICSETLAAYRRLGSAVHNLPRGEPSRALWLRVQQGLPSARAGLFWRRLLPLASAMAMLVVALTVIAVLGFRAMRPAATQAPEVRVAQAPYQAVAPTAAAPEAAAEATLTTLGAVSSSVPLEGAAAATAAPCPGSPVSLQVVSLSIRSDAQRSTPGLQGVLYDAQGLPVPGVTLVISGTAGWVGTATTADDGTFALELPEGGTYRIVMGLSTAAAKDQEGQVTGTLDYYALPSGEVCGAPRGVRLAPTTLENQEVAILTLTLRAP